MAVSQLVYVSRAVDTLGVADLMDIREISVERNAELDITGVLLYSAGWFMQLLEGAHDEVERLYERIRRDPRHDSVRLLLFRPGTRRLFEHWSMRLVNLDERLELSEQEIAWLHELLDLCTSLSGDDAALALIMSFRRRLAGKA